MTHAHAVTSAPREQTKGLVWPLMALCIGGFAFGTSEFVIMGLLPNIAGALAVDIPTAGRLISAYAVGVMIGAPVLALLAASWPRRAALIALMAVCAVGNLGMAASNGPITANIMRLASGLPHGAFFGMAAMVAASLAPEGKRGQAIGYVMLGLTGAMLFGAPFGTWIGQTFSWRISFVGVAIVAMLSVVLIAAFVPKSPVQSTVMLRNQFRALLNARIWSSFLIAGVGFAGMFCVFSYITPALLHAASMDKDLVPLALILFGVGGVAGNLVGGRLADKAVMPTIIGVLIYAAVLLACFGTLLENLLTALVGILLLGGIVAIGPALQLRIMGSASEGSTLAASLIHSAFNFANAIGAWVGGVIIAAQLGWPALGWAGAALAVCGLFVSGLSFGIDRLSARTEAHVHGC